MAPTGSIVEIQESVASKALTQVKKGTDKGDEVHSDCLPRMTPALLQKICKERQMWLQPHLNTQLFLNYKGFLRIEGLEDYCNVRSLLLDSNNISKIEGLERMTDLRNLNLGGNRITVIEGLEYNVDLRHLNLEGNAITRVVNVSHLVNLESLNMSANRVESLEDLEELKELPKLSNMDISTNLIETEEGVVEFWSQFKSMRVLRYHGNPGVRHVTHYRKRLVNALTNLTYLDERPVFPVERKSCQAWETGGLTAMHEAKKEFHQQRLAACHVDDDRKALVTKMRKMAIERLDREAKEREEKEEKMLEEMNQKKKGPEDGDPEALQEYSKVWQKKVNLYGADEVRAKVGQEMGGKRVSTPQAWAPPVVPRPEAQAPPAQREHQADFDFAPLMQAQAPPAQREHKADFNFAPSSRTTSATGRQPERAPVHVADFCTRSTGEIQDHTDRVFSVLSDDAEASNLNADACGAPGRGAATGSGKAKQAASEHVMPLIWEQRQAENAAAEAACMEQNMKASQAFSDHAAGPAAFRSNQLEGLD